MLSLSVSKFAKLSTETSAAQIHDWELNQALNLYSASSECNFFGEGLHTLCAQQPNKLHQSTQTVGAQQESEKKAREEESQAELNHY